MNTPAKGIKKQVFGGMLVCLSAITVWLAEMIGFELDPFYVVLFVTGGGLFLYGAIQKKQHNKLAQHESYNRFTKIISNQKEGQ